MEELHEDLFNTIISRLTNAEKINISSTSKWFRQNVKCKFMKPGELLIKKNFYPAIYSKFAVIDSLDSAAGKVVMRYLDVATDGQGNMWPLTPESCEITSIGYMQRIIIPRDVSKTMDVKDFKSAWLPHDTCTHHGAFLPNTHCACVYDDVINRTHVPKYKKREKLCVKGESCIMC